MRAASGAIAFEAAGEQVLKGKAAPVRRGARCASSPSAAARAAARRSSRRSSDATTSCGSSRTCSTRPSRERGPRLVSVIGQAGIGKSRLGVGVPQVHRRRRRGRLLAPGTLARLRRGRSRSGRSARWSGDGPASPRPTTRRRRASRSRRRWRGVRARRGASGAGSSRASLPLLGVEEAPAGEREELFAAWRTFFERVADTGPTVLVFEDLQWADAGLLDFIDHLLEWSRALPDLRRDARAPGAARSAAGLGRRAAATSSALALEPLPTSAMRELLDGLVPGLPEAAVARDPRRAPTASRCTPSRRCGCCSDEGRLEPRMAPTGRSATSCDLAVPESLQALIAARLDGLDSADRALLQDGAVLGQTFTLDRRWPRVTGKTRSRSRPRLRALVRRELLELDVDPRSPERGQYGFVQALIREVAYGTLAQRDRRTRHLAAARYFESLERRRARRRPGHALPGRLPGAAPEGQEGRRGRSAGADRPTRRRRSAAALHSHDQALAFLDQALEVTPDAADRVELLDRAHRSTGRRSIRSQHGPPPRSPRARPRSRRPGRGRALDGQDRRTAVTRRTHRSGPCRDPGGARGPRRCRLTRPSSSFKHGLPRVTCAPRRMRSLSSGPTAPSRGLSDST